MVYFIAMVYLKIGMNQYIKSNNNGGYKRMGELLKRTDDYRVNDEAEAEALIEKAKTDPNNEGYELTSYKMVKKNKKSKGEIIEEWIIVTLVKQW